MDVLVLVLILSSMGLMVVALFIADERRKVIRRFNQTPRVPIADAAPGQEICILGTVQPDGEEFISPFTKRRCVYYEAIVAENKGSKAWTEIIREVRCASFIVEDKSGRVLVKAKDLKIQLNEDLTDRSGFLNDPSAQYEEFLARHGQSSRDKRYNRTLRYREGVFQQGEVIAVLGRIRWEHDPNPQEPGKGYRDVPKQAVVEPLASGQVWVSDLREIVYPEQK